MGMGLDIGLEDQGLKLSLDTYKLCSFREIIQYSAMKGAKMTTIHLSNR